MVSGVGRASLGSLPYPLRLLFSPSAVPPTSVLYGSTILWWLYQLMAHEIEEAWLTFL